MAAPWPAGVPDAFLRDTYERAPEDVVTRRAPDVGPPLRKLRAPTAAQMVRGELSLTDPQLTAFDAWRTNTLDYGRDAFDFALRDHPAPRTVEARFRGGPIMLERTKRTRRVRLEIMIAPPAPTPGALTALAALDNAAPAAWPVGVPGMPLQQKYDRTNDDQVRRPDDRNSPGGDLASRLEGRTEKVSLTMSAAELETFESWFEVTAAMGVRDILFPVPTGTHTGCFNSSYTVAGAQNLDGWRVSFERYLEARP